MTRDFDLSMFSSKLFHSSLIAKLGNVLLHFKVLERMQTSIILKDTYALLTLSEPYDNSNFTSTNFINLKHYTELKVL